MSLCKDVITIVTTTRVRQSEGKPKDTSAATLANLLKENWHEMTAAANRSSNHVKFAGRWFKKAEEATPSLADEQAAQLAEMMRKQHYVRMGKLSAEARRVARQVRCRVLALQLRNPCSGEALDDLGVCLHHLEEITLHWCDRVAHLIGQFGGKYAEKLRVVVVTLQRHSGGRP